MSETSETEREEPLAFGVPAGALVSALRGAGMADTDIIAVVGRAIARSAGVAEELTATPPFVFQTPIAETAPECAMTYHRGFVHPDFIDGVTVVQAGATSEEMGFNQRFHTIETELDLIEHDLRTSGNCVAELRRELSGMARELEAKITEIDTRLDAKVKDKDKEKDFKESKEKETKEGKESKEKDTKESKDKEGKDGKETKEKDTKEKDTKEKEEKERAKDDQKEFLDFAGPLPPGSTVSAAEPSEEEGDERTFVRLEDRPEVGGAALAEPDADDEDGRDDREPGGGA